jgi:transcriptional regulator with XRE-family HTH domain
MSVKDRLTQYLDSKNISKSAFGRDIGVSSAYISSIRKSIQPEKIKRIALKYPDLNTTWLLTGDGEMLKAAPREADSRANTNHPTIDRLLSIIESQQRTIENLSNLLASGRESNP